SGDAHTGRARPVGQPADPAQGPVSGPADDAGDRKAFASPPADPSRCVFSRVSVNYSADLKTQVQPCFFGGQPDCSQCGCAVTGGLHWIGSTRLFGPLRASHLMEASMAVGSMMARAERGRM